MGSNLCCSRHPDTYESTTGNNGDRSLPTGDDKFLSDASTFSVKEQESQLKAARLEEQRLGREAEKVNSWVKHESARFDHLPYLTIVLTKLFFFFYEPRTNTIYILFWFTTTRNTKFIASYIRHDTYCCLQIKGAKNIDFGAKNFFGI